ncbi:bcl-2-like protein 12 [Protopterus annectens]|uniref:bcl-2-like protein 12 n=1 Tax=Protopterus annectens TaxID=7888 RepID=UPI001CF961DD|nr:bcl-2-like protein 12 [Protopterus annectens]
MESEIDDKVTSSADKENLIQRLVDILNQQAECVNKKLDEDVDLKRSLSRMSYHSFSRLADVFTSQVETSLESQGSTTPELAKIALTMELTRKVAGINSHAVQTLMGYSMQYMDMFVPWLQQNGGWENVVQGDVVEFQID